MAQKLNLKLDITDITLGDLETLTSRESTFSEKMDVLRRVVTEGDVAQVKLVDLPKLINMIEAELNDAVNPTTPASS